MNSKKITDGLIFVFSIALVLSGGYYFLELGSTSGEKFVAAAVISTNSIILYDGEPGSAVLSSATCLDNATEDVGGGMGGGNSLKIAPTKWASSRFSFNCAGQSRVNFSSYDYLEFYIKASTAGGNPYVSFTSYVAVAGSATESNRINISGYVEGGAIDTNWHRVKIPLSVFKTATWGSLDGTDWMSFGPTDATGRFYNIDSLASKKETGGASPAPPQTPPPTTTPPPATPPATTTNPTPANPTPTPTPTPNPVVAPSPVTVSVSGITSDSMTVSWSSVTGNGGYKVFIAGEPESLSANSSRKLMATLPSSASSYQLTGLSALTDVFIRVEASGTTSYGDAYGKTVGGPKKTLATPLREVHLMSPSIVELVLENKRASYDPNTTSVTLNTGADWQAGTWTVTRHDGTPIAVSSVSRHSIPVGQPQYTTGPNLPDYRQNNINIVDVDHRIFLRLAEAVGTSEVLTITHSNTPATAINFSFPFSDKYTITPSIQVNQVGYNPMSNRRYAYVSGFLGDGGTLSLSSFPTTASVIKESAVALDPRVSVVSSLSVSQRSVNDTDSGGEVREINLSNVPQAEGVFYHVRLPGVGVSWPTQVSNLSIFKAFYTATRALFYERWGRDLNCAYTEWCPRPPDHQFVYTDDTKSDDGTEFPRDKVADPSKRRPLVGGYHDAGDFDQRRNHTMVAEWLLRAYELSPSKFRDNQLNIPESGNGIPDLLDEALWGVKGWRNLQEADGGVRAGVNAAYQTYGIYYMDQEMESISPFFTYKRDPDVTDRAAALFAQASRLVAPFDSAKAADLRDAAEKAWTWAEVNGVAPAARLFASSELYHLTGKNVYKVAFEDNFKNNYYKDWDNNGYDTGDGMRNVINDRLLQWGDNVLGTINAGANYFVGYAMSPNTDPGIMTVIRENIGREALNNSKNIDASYAHRKNGFGPYYAYGQANTPGANIIQVFARLQLGLIADSEKQNLIDALSLDEDFMYGANPPGISWTTGLGSRYPMEPLHIESLAFMKDGRDAVPGLSLYGISLNAPRQSYYMPVSAMFYPDYATQPPLFRFADDRTYVISSEFTVTETLTPNALLLSVLLPDSSSLPSCWKPGTQEHLSTLPMPCSGNTVTPPASNRAPSVSAGLNQSGFVNSAVSLSSSVYDDGLPNNTLSYSWTKVSGPGTVTFVSASARDTSASFSAVGSYVIHLNVSDGSLSSGDDVSVNITAGTPTPTTPTNPTTLPTPNTPTTPTTPTPLQPTGVQDNTLPVTGQAPLTNPTTPTVNPSTPTGVFTKTLNPNDTGDDIRKLQTLLKAEKYAISETGVFDAKTEEAVKNFQCDKKIVCFGAPNGGLGPTTKGSFGTVNLDTIAVLNKVASDRAIFQTNNATSSTQSASVKITTPITQYLTLGSRHAEVKIVEQILNNIPLEPTGSKGTLPLTGQAHPFQVALTGPGSPGNETDLMTTATVTALRKFQCATLSVCSGAPSSTGYGATGPRTRSALSKLGGAPLEPKSTTLSGLPLTGQASSFGRTLTIGSRGIDVRALQKRLNAEGFTIATGLDSTGSPRAGSPGNETTYFGPATRLAVIRFQEKYASEILVPSGFTKGTGFVGQATLKKLQSVTR